jgi:hypothetical protein
MLKLCEHVSCQPGLNNAPLPPSTRIHAGDLAPDQLTERWAAAGDSDQAVTATSDDVGTSSSQAASPGGGASADDASPSSPVSSAGGSASVSSSSQPTSLLCSSLPLSPHQAAASLQDSTSSLVDAAQPSTTADIPGSSSGSQSDSGPLLLQTDGLLADAELDALLQHLAAAGGVSQTSSELEVLAAADADEPQPPPGTTAQVAAGATPALDQPVHKGQQAQQAAPLSATTPAALQSRSRAVATVPCSSSSSSSGDEDEEEWQAFRQQRGPRRCVPAATASN